MLEYEGYFEGGQFISFGAASIPDRRKVRITIFDEVVSKDVERNLSELDSLIAMVKNSAGDPVPNFERADFNREVVI